jgi:hypothetical protein
VAHPSEKQYASQFLCKNHTEGDWAFPRTSMLPPYSVGMVKAGSDYTLRDGDGFPNFLGQLNGYGNAVVPQIPELIGRAIKSALIENANP